MYLGWEAFARYTIPTHIGGASEGNRGVLPPLHKDLPRDSALYDISVRRLISLHLGFLQTPPHGDALAIG
jgi:hypothetical protein